MSRSEIELQHSEIHLSSEQATHPANLTPEMLLWYQTHVLGPRRMALEEIKQAFEADRSSSGVSGFLLEAEVDAIEQDKVRSISLEAEKFRDSQNVKGILADLQSKAIDYATVRDHQGRT